MMKKNLLLIVLLILPTISLVFGKKISGDISPIFDVSPDGKRLALSIRNGKESFIYLYSIDDENLKQLTTKKGAYHSRPMFSPDGKKIVFLTKQLSIQKSQIAVFDLESRKIEELKTSVSFVTEAIFHPDGKRIIYCAAGFIGNYSPMARKAPHEIDIYSVNIDGTNELKITDYSAYELSSISMDKEGRNITFEAKKKDKLDGIYVMSLVNTSKIEKIEAKNNPRPDIGSSFYGNPNYSSDHSSISFIAPYQVYTLDLASKECKLIWDNTKDKVMVMPIHTRFVDSDRKIILSTLKIINRQYASNATFVVVDVEKGKNKELIIKQ